MHTIIRVNMATVAKVAARQTLCLVTVLLTFARAERLTGAKSRSVREVDPRNLQTGPSAGPSAAPSTPNLHVLPNTKFTLPSGLQLAYDQVIVDGVLSCPERGDVKLTANRVIVQGAFECGRPGAPPGGTIKINLSGAPRRIEVLDGGRLTMEGLGGREGSVRLAGVAPAGSSSLRIRGGVPAGWRAGDEIVVTTSRFHRQKPNQWLNGASDRLGENERHVIRRVVADRVILSRPLDFAHYGGDPQTYFNSLFALDEAAIVANLKRSIQITGDGVDGGDVIAFRGSTLKLRNVELAQLGRAGKLGKYPIHWHKCGSVPGQYVESCSIHSTRQRCIVVHGTNFARVAGNTCFDFFGHGIMLEDGDERHNEIVDNLVILAKKPLPELALLQSEFVDKSISRFPGPAGLWISHPTNRVEGNTAVASEGTGIWNSFARDLCCTNLTSCEIKPPANCDPALGEYSLQPHRADTTQFDSNTARSCVVGMNWDGAALGPLANNPNNPLDREIQFIHYAPGNTPTFSNNTVFKSSLSALYIRSRTTVFDRLIMADNGFGPVFAFNNVLRNSLIVGWSANAEVDFFFEDPAESRGEIRSQNRVTSVHLYDGPWIFESLYVAGHPSEKVVTTRSITKSGQTVNYPYDVTPRVFSTIAAFQRFNNWVQNVVFEQPVPYYLTNGRWPQSAALYYNYGLTRLTITGAAPINRDPSRCPTGQFRGSATLLCANYEVSFLVYDGFNADPLLTKNIRALRATDGRPCDWACYLQRYSDLQTLLGPNNTVGAASHYENTGSKEGRDCTCECAAPVEETCPTYASWDDLSGKSPAGGVVQLIQNAGAGAPGGFRYHLHMDLQSPTERFNFRADSLNQVSPPLYVNYGPHCDAMQVFSVDGDTGTPTVPFSNVSTEAQLVSASVSTNSVWDMGPSVRKLAIRVIADSTTKMPKFGGGGAAWAAGSPSQYTGMFELRCVGPRFDPGPGIVGANIPEIYGRSEALLENPYNSSELLVMGWACVNGTQTPVLVELREFYEGPALASQLANQSSGPWIEAICGGATATEFHSFFFSAPKPTNTLSAVHVVASSNISNTRKTLFNGFEDLAPGTPFDAWLNFTRSLPTSGYVG